jgi:hypothetical protein
VKKSLLVKCVLMCSILSTVSFGAMQVYNDSFESPGQTAGSSPVAPWNPAYATSTAISNAHAHTGTQSINLNASNTTNGVVGQDSAYYSQGMVQFWFMQPGSLKNADFQVYVTNAASEVYVSMDINFSTGKILWKNAIGGYGSTNLAGTTTLANNVWYTVQVQYNVNTATANVFFNGVQTGTNLALYNNDKTLAGGTVTRVYLAGNTAAATAFANPVFIDDWSLSVLTTAGNGKYLKADASRDFYVNAKDFSVIARDWLKNIDLAYLDSQITNVPWKPSLPGYYVASIKALNSSNNNFARLCMYTFNANGTVQNSFWSWGLPDANTSSMLSDRTIGTDINTPPSPQNPSGATDATCKVVGLSKFLNGAATLTSLTGTYTRSGREILISYSDGSWENWYQTWEEPNNLYKLELYDASYLKTGTVSWVRSTTNGFVRDANAHSAGWAFGSNSHDFTYAAPVSQFLKNLVGCSLDFGYTTANVDTIDDDSMANFYNVGFWTNNNVIRYCYQDAGNPSAPWVYSYFTAPLSNPGTMARRTLYQCSHDFNNNGNIQDDPGHMMAGLQIIDNAGNYRGSVLVQYSNSGTPWVNGLYWLDTVDTPSELASRTTINGLTIEEENYDSISWDVGRPSGSDGWWFSTTFANGAEAGFTAQNPSPVYSQPYSMACDANTNMRWSSPVQAVKGYVSYKLYLAPNATTGKNADYYVQGPINGTWTVLVFMSSDYIYDRLNGSYFTGVISTGAWHDIEWVYDCTQGTTGQITLYVDGSSRGTHPLGAAAQKYMGVCQWSQTAGMTPSQNLATRYYDNMVIGYLVPQNCSDVIMMGYQPASDINGDCIIDMKDIQLLAQEWLECSDPTTWNCTSSD